MIITAFVSQGFDGEIVNVEVDIRRGIPGIDIVGLPDSAVREAKERVRVSIKNSGYTFPRNRVLINLAPADVRKEGASFDLPLAVAILAGDGQITPLNHSETLSAEQKNHQVKVMVLGELELSGTVRRVRGVMAAVQGGIRAGVQYFIVPIENRNEALTVQKERVYGISRLSQVQTLFTFLAHGKEPPGETIESDFISPSLNINTWQESKQKQHQLVKYQLDHMQKSSIPGSLQTGESFGLICLPLQGRVKRALEIAAAGGHHILLFGPPGSGKTMAGFCLAALLPKLTHQESLEVTRIQSLAGNPLPESGLFINPPFRTPHHSASLEGVIGGSNTKVPGEISLAHKGVLFLDEIHLFKSSLIQALRGPMERKRVAIARSDVHYWYPAHFQLALATNPCACGNLGRPEGRCLCSKPELHRHWKKLGTPLMDRIDIRVPVEPVTADKVLSYQMHESHETQQEEALLQIKKRIEQAVKYQREQNNGGNNHYDNNQIRIKNGDITPQQLSAFDPSSVMKEPLQGEINMLKQRIQKRFYLEPKTKGKLIEAANNIGLSPRAIHGVIKVARTIADLDQKETIEKDHILASIELRRYGDSDYFWKEG